MHQARRLLVSQYLKLHPFVVQKIICNIFFSDFDVFQCRLKKREIDESRKKKGKELQPQLAIFTQLLSQDSLSRYSSYQQFFYRYAAKRQGKFVHNYTRTVGVRNNDQQNPSLYWLAAKCKLPRTHYLEILQKAGRNEANESIEKRVPHSWQLFEEFRIPVTPLKNKIQNCSSGNYFHIPTFQPNISQGIFTCQGQLLSKQSKITKHGYSIRKNQPVSWANMCVIKENEFFTIFFSFYPFRIESIHDPPFSTYGGFCWNKQVISPPNTS